ncbi:meiosis-specific protein MEI4 [Psammomys obesus]|uniref:meiosis-specific protein MEI4 n=1 Tax=Psammomys obesus TaxID=48139 RepID=UPI002452CB46|nr:meiosis-specific protein MEI4 [Psammomys obesus]
MDMQKWYLKTSKLALALAIIRSKPADRSSREYTEHLATLVTQQESKWKSKIAALEAEVLQLRQKLFLSKISSGLFKNVENNRGIDNSSWLIFWKVSEVWVNEIVAEDLAKEYEQRVRIRDYTPFRIPSQILCFGVTRVLVSRSRLLQCPFQVQHYVSQSLVTLGSCGLLRKSIISLLLSEVNSFVDDLGAIIQGQGNYNVTRYENIFSLFLILEQLLQQETQGDATTHIDHSSPEIQTFLHKHDETVFQLSDAFPLFTFYLWRLGILLNSAEMETAKTESSP